jgi:hypothetical protein
LKKEAKDMEESADRKDISLPAEKEGAPVLTDEQMKALPPELYEKYLRGELTPG